jgi:hypothetical protein
MPVDPQRLRGWLDDFAAYRYAVTKASIESWFDQFQQEHRDTAARVLDVIEFFGADRIAAALRKAIGAIPGWDIVSGKRKGQWRFVAYSGSAGESGDTMLHQFRLANGLDGKKFKDLFIHRSEIVLQQLGSEDTLVFLDDFVGTGNQVCEFWTETFAELTAGIGRVYLMVVAAVQGARKKIENETDLVLVPCHELGENDNLFSDRCVHFTPHAKKALLHYDEIANKKHPRGYGDCGLVVVFQHRCPNDSIPILHANHSNWTGLFPRHD